MERPSSAPAAVASLCVFVLAFACSWAGVFWVLLAEMFSMRAKVRFISHTLVPIQYSTTPFARRAPFREDLRSVKKTHHVSPRGNATLCYPPIARPNTVPDARSSSLGESNRIESNRIESRQAAATAACVSTLFAAGAAADAAFLPLAETTGAGGCVLYTGPHTTAFAC
jgi:hypothetical protein